MFVLSAHIPTFVPLLSDNQFLASFPERHQHYIRAWKDPARARSSLVARLLLAKAIHGIAHMTISQTASPSSFEDPTLIHYCTSQKVDELTDISLNPLYDLEQHPEGWLYFRSLPYHCSISHCPDMTVCAVIAASPSEHSQPFIGIDIERCMDCAPATRAFSQQEQSFDTTLPAPYYLNPHAEQERRRPWTIHDANSKASSSGIRIVPLPYHTCAHHTHL